MANIPTPSINEVAKYINQWENSIDLKHYREQKKALKWLFQQFPKHNNLDEVLIKSISSQ